MDAFAAACLSVFSLIGLANVLYGLPHLVAVMFLRPVAASIVLIVCSVAVIAGYTMIVAGSDPLARLAVILALLPFPVYWLVSFWTWMRVDEESRVAAWRIRSEIADRYEEPGPREGWYPALVYDLERLRRRDSYEAPAIN